jgi:hypothetical protein
MPYRRVKHKDSALKKWGKKQMLQLASQSALIVIQRTQVDGKGVDDRPLPTYVQQGGKSQNAFGAYSKGHGRLRKFGGKYGRIRIGGGLPVNRITLSVTGRMFQQFRVIGSSVRKYIAQFGPTGASSKYAKHTHSRRPWIGFSKSDRSKVLNVFRAIWRSM